MKDIKRYTISHCRQHHCKIIAEHYESSEPFITEKSLGNNEKLEMITLRLDEYNKDIGVNNET